MVSNHTRRVSDRTDRPGLRRRSAGGFTLIEVLVVVAIIALLVSILLPSLQRAREQAKSVICKTHMRNIGQAMNIYCFMYNDVLPWAPTNAAGTTFGFQPWEFYYKVIQKGIPRRMTVSEITEKTPYIGTSSDYYYLLDWYVCPKDKVYQTTSQTTSIILPGSTTGITPTFVLSYCCAHAVFTDIQPPSSMGGTGKNSPLKLGALKRQSDMVLAGEFVDDTTVSMPGGWILTDHGKDGPSLPSGAGWPGGPDCNQIDLWEVRHLGGSNVVYMDGHVNFHKVNYSDTINWGLPNYLNCFFAPANDWLKKKVVADGWTARPKPYP